MAKKDYFQLSKEELIEKIKGLKEQKKYGLTWENKVENVVRQCLSELPVLEEVKQKAIKGGDSPKTNLLIEGDNYHSLSVLNYTHYRKVDLIYIDPPFNTGSQDFSFNDKYVDKEDGFRHSKWLSFMYIRIALCKDLLKHTGSIFVHIDANEFAQLKMLMDDVFGEDNFRSCIVWQRSSSGKTISRNLADDVDFLLWYSKGPEYYFNKVYKPLSENTKNMYSKNDNDGRGYYRLYPLQKTGGPGPETTYDYIDNTGKVWTCPVKGWRMKQSKLKNLENDGRLFLLGKKLSEKAYWDERDNEGQVADNIWTDIPNIQGNNSERVDFTGGQKPVTLMNRIISLASHKNGIILDYFAGSGTTGHSVLALNSQDGGNRRFILCTNNENKIAEEVTYPRIKNVIKGLPANLRYFKTAFVSKSKVSDDVKYKLVERSTEMICIREDTFDEVLNRKYIKIFKNADHYTAILFHLDYFSDFMKELHTLDKETHIYVFSLTTDTYDEDFRELKQKYALCPIPESILQVYRRVFREK